jgi:Coenzyme PQQ synthesis protein D (PqqD)
VTAGALKPRGRTHKIWTVQSGDGSRLPRKAEGLEVSEVVDGYVVYQPERDRVHYLNRTALLVLELCNGDSDLDQITTLVQQAFELSAPPEDEVGACLALLRDERLVT